MEVVCDEGGSGGVHTGQATPGCIGARMSGGGRAQSEVGKPYARQGERGGAGKQGIEHRQSENALPDRRGGGVPLWSGGGSSWAPSSGRRAPDVRLIPEEQRTAPGLPHVTKRNIGSGAHARRTCDALPCYVCAHYYSSACATLAMFEGRLRGEKGSQNKPWADQLYIYIYLLPRTLYITAAVASRPGGRANANAPPSDADLCRATAGRACR